MRLGAPASRENGTPGLSSLADSPKSNQLLDDSTASMCLQCVFFELLQCIYRARNIAAEKRTIQCIMKEWSK